MPDELKLLTIGEAMEILRIDDERTMNRIISNGRLPYRQVSNKRLIADDDLRRYVASCRMVGKKCVPLPSPADSDLRRLAATSAEALEALSAALRDRSCGAAQD